MILFDIMFVTFTLRQLRSAHAKIMLKKEVVVMSVLTARSTFKKAILRGVPIVFVREKHNIVKVIIILLGAQ